MYIFFSPNVNILEYVRFKLKPFKVSYKGLLSMSHMRFPYLILLGKVV